MPANLPARQGGRVPVLAASVGDTFSALMLMSPRGSCVVVQLPLHCTLKLAQRCMYIRHIITVFCCSTTRYPTCYTSLVACTRLYTAGCCSSFSPATGERAPGTAATPVAMQRCMTDTPESRSMKTISQPVASFSSCYACWAYAFYSVHRMATAARFVSPNAMVPPRPFDFTEGGVAYLQPTSP